MGKNQSKTLNSLLTTLGFASGDERKARRQSDVMSHSNSLNSISTAVSFNTEMSHSNSMDNLLRQKPHNTTGSKSKGHQSSFLKRRDSGKVYDALVETSSIVTAFSDAIVENGGAYEDGITQSLPASLTHHTKIRTDSTHLGMSNGAVIGASSTAHRSNFHPSRQGSSFEGGVPSAGWRGGGEREDGFSDKFVLNSEASNSTQAGLREVDGNGKVLGESGELGGLSGPYLHPAIVKKLSHEEWHELISYACATLGQTLFTSILERIKNSQLLLQSDQSELTEAADKPEGTPPPNEGSIWHASSKETSLTSSVHQSDVDGMCIESVEDLLLKLRELRCRDKDNRVPSTPPKLERTASLPPLNRHQVKPETQQQLYSPTDQRLANFEPTTRGGEGSGLQHRWSGHVEQETALPHLRSKSHGESDWRSMRPHRQARRERRCGKCGGGGGTGAGGEGENRYHLHGSRKRSGRTKSDGKQRDSGSNRTRVDPSLDDDCPGVLENRVRRPRHHQYLCKQCLGGGAAAERGSRGSKGGGAGSVPTSTGRKGWDGGDPTIPPGRSTNTGGQDGPTLVMTLEDVRAALLLEKSTEFVESGEEETLLGGDDSHHTSQVYPQTVSSLLDSTPHGVRPSSARDDVSESGRAEADYCWREVPYTSLPSRSGRDSPATDMAVACLDMNSERMLRPLNGSRSMEWRGGVLCEGGGGGRSLPAAAPALT